jgi:anti-sigma-K factor RskA
MESNGIHELTAAYALDALDENEQREYEEHLRLCARCREELTSLQNTAQSLAYAVPAPAPPLDLRRRIVEQAMRERRNVVPFRPRRSFRPALAVAAVAASVAVGLGVWAASLSRSLDREQEARERERIALSILAEPRAQQISISGTDGRLVVSMTRKAVLVLPRLDPAPEGKAYEAWVIADGRPVPAGLFDGRQARDVVPLEQPVPPNAAVAVTLENDEGADQPTGSALFSVKT